MNEDAQTQQVGCHQGTLTATRFADYQTASGPVMSLQLPAAVQFVRPEVF